ncbi:MAG: dephospho-CoA kinase [Burkholderiales bacterium]
MTYAIGLTGGVGCGKSSAARFFADLGAGIVDTDTLAHELTRPGEPALLTIASQFGRDFLLRDGSLDRARLRRLIFSDAQAKTRLESILHPLIRQRVEVELSRQTAPYTLVIVPLLLETGHYRDIVQRVLLVDCDEMQQIARVAARNGLSELEIRAIMAHQMMRGERLQLSDDTLDNRGEESALAPQIAVLHRKYLALAALAKASIDTPH